MDNKIILFGKEAREKLVEGIDLIANPVKVTLGYGGRTVVISEMGMPARTTKDGVTVANRIKLRDEIKEAGAKIIKETSAKTGDDVGDGTTTVCVLMQKMVHLGMALIEKNNAVYVKKGMEIAAKNIVKMLESMKIGVTPALLKSIATVSANNDETVGRLISDAYKKIGDFGTISIEDSNSTETWVEYVEGYQFLCGLFSPHFINNTSKNTCELNNPYILVIEGKINGVGSIKNILELVAKERRSLYIIAEDFEYSVPQTLLQNSHLFQSCIVKYNFSGETKQEIIYDLCAVTGATIAEKKGDILQNMKGEYLGSCEKIIVSSKDTIIIKGDRKKEDVDARIKDAQIKISDSKNHPVIRQRQEERIAKLNGNIAICYVGGSTEVEISEKKDRIDDSIKATKAAIQEGILPGAGTSLIRIAPLLSELAEYKEQGINEGIKLMQEAIKEPTFMICQNATGRGAAWLERIEAATGNEGYNVITERIDDLVEAGIVDPLKVVKKCIENATSAASQILISEALIVTDF